MRFLVLFLLIQLILGGFTFTSNQTTEMVVMENQTTSAVEVQSKKSLSDAVMEAEYDEGYYFEVADSATVSTSIVSFDAYASPTGGMYMAQMPMETEEYSPLADQGFTKVSTSPLSTFAADVDTASYANVRRMIQNQQFIPPDSVRIEEFINAFAYSDPAPTGDTPLAIHTQVAVCPWNEDHLLMRIGLKAKAIDTENLPPLNLVFLIDSSGSMYDSNKLPLVKRSFALLTEQLRPQDRVSIVTYAGSSSVLLEGVSGSEKATILNAIDGIEAAGSTAGADGIETAYRIAERFASPSIVSRVLLATDGDFNVGISSEAELIRFIESKKENGIFLSVLGYGMGNLKDTNMQALANHGNGNATYIDTIHQARSALVEEMGATLFTIAKDVKLQVEFNPATVEGYRLIGYENRRLANEDFRDDSKDGGEIGSGHSVIALYELIPAGSGELPDNALTYQQTVPTQSTDFATVTLRYKEPDGDQAMEVGHVVPIEALTDELSQDFALSAAAAAFGLLLSNSDYAGNASEQMVLDLIQPMLSGDTGGRIVEFSTLVRKSNGLYGEQ